MVTFEPTLPDGSGPITLHFALDPRARLSRLEQLYCPRCLPGMLPVAHAGG